jgi:hypothetical protein
MVSWQTELEELILKENPKALQKERRTELLKEHQRERQMELQKGRLKGLLKERLREHQREWARRWRIVVAGCNVVAAFGVVCHDDAGEAETVEMLHQRCCWCCHQHHSKPHSVRSSPIASSKSQERIGIPCFHRKSR